jgi:hypothetical protein
MHGQGPFLGLTVREGVVCAYSVEARNQFTGSNVRGHLLLHVTDHARHPHAFGGQPALTLAPGRPTGSSGSLPGSRTRRPSWPWSGPWTARRSPAGPTVWSSSTSAPTAVTPSGVRGLRHPDRPDRDRPGLARLVGRRRADGHAGAAGRGRAGPGWLLAFAGPQRHVRLRHVAVRHWDGYWFGLRRQWGDIFPHYWPALTAVALLELPDELRSERGDRMAEAILRANLGAGLRPALGPRP